MAAGGGQGLAPSNDSGRRGCVVGLDDQWAIGLAMLNGDRLQWVGVLLKRSPHNLTNRLAALTGYGVRCVP
jgi:hypothetical protein